MPEAELTPGQVLWRLDRLAETFDRRLNEIGSTLDRRLSDIEVTIDRLDASYVRKETFAIELERRREQLMGEFTRRDEQISVLRHELDRDRERTTRWFWFLASLLGAVTTAVVAQIITSAVIR